MEKKIIMKQGFSLTRIVFLFVFLIFMFFEIDSAFCDVVYLKNEDRVTGEVIEESEEAVSVRTETMGVISIKRDSIKRIVCADVICLKNKDKITGQVMEQTEESVSVKTEALGVVSVKRDSIERISNVIKERISKSKKDDIQKIAWKKEVSVGYNKSSGNTQTSQLVASGYINRKTTYDEFTIKGDTHYSSSKKKMNAQRWHGMARYAFSFWKNKWYNFFKFEADHDRFANRDYRLVPSTGIMYRFSDTPDWKAIVEGGIGYEHTSYRDGTKEYGEATLISRAFFEKKLFDNLTISQDITLYPSLGGEGEYRLHSETSFISPINEKLSLRLSLVDDYDSNPTIDVKKNDWRLISSLVCSF